MKELRFLLVLLLLLANPQLSALAEENIIDKTGPSVAAWGWHAGAWCNFLKNEYGIECLQLKLQDNRLPVEDFSRYRMVVLDRFSTIKPLSDDENKKVQNYLYNGGVILMAGGPTTGWLERAGDIGWAGWTGGARRVWERPVKPSLAEDEPLLEGCKRRDYAWLSAYQGLSDIYSGRVLAGSERVAALLINRYGKGAFVYASSSLIGEYKEGWLGNDEAVSWLSMAGKLAVAAVKGGKTLDEALGKNPVRKHGAVMINGSVRETVICAEQSSLRGARLLAGVLNKITASQLRIVTADVATPEDFRIHVGITPFVKKALLAGEHRFDGEYHIRMVDKNNLVILGRTSYAVIDFLKRFAGYRWFMPGELGEITPSREQISLPVDLNITAKPSLVTYLNFSYGADSAFCRHDRLTLKATHNLHVIFAPEKYGESHPEYYPMLNGKRVVPRKGAWNDWQPCISNPDMPGVVMEWARRFFADKPASPGFSVGVNDGVGDCQCQKCMTWRRDYGNQYIPFYNEVARRVQKEFPGKLVGFIPYNSAAPVPKNLKLEPNLYCETISGLAKNMAGFRQWETVGCKNFGLYDYLYGNDYVVPRHYPHIMGNAWKRAHREFGMSGAFLESTTIVWLYDGPRLYVLNELAWDMNADIEKLLDDYFNCFYGSAARPARRFFDRIEEIYARKKDPLSPFADSRWMGPDVNQFAEYTRQDISYLDKCIREMLTSADKADATGMRAALLGKVYGLTKLYLEAYLSIKDMQQRRIADEKDAEAVINDINTIDNILKAKNAYSMSPWEEANIFTRVTLQDFKSMVKIDRLFEMGAEERFSSISDCLKKIKGWPAARAFWEKNAARIGNENLSRLAMSQVSRIENKQAQVNLMDNPSFEDAAAAAGGNDLTIQEDVLKKFEWTRFDNTMKGWAVWPAIDAFYRDNTAARTGSKSLSIRANTLGASFVYRRIAKPGEIYRFSVWVKQNPANKGGRFSIRWENEKGWADSGPQAAPIFTCDYPKAETIGWRQAEIVFVVPKNVTRMVILLNAPRQSGDEAIWFDDICLFRLSD